MWRPGVTLRCHLSCIGLPWFFETGSLIGLEFADSARLVAFEAQGSAHLNLPCGDYLNAQCSAFYADSEAETPLLVGQAVCWPSCLHTPVYLTSQDLTLAFFFSSHLL